MRVELLVVLLEDFFLGLLFVPEVLARVEDMLLRSAALTSLPSSGTFVLGAPMESRYLAYSSILAWLESPLSCISASSFMKYSALSKNVFCVTAEYLFPLRLLRFQFFFVGLVQQALHPLRLPLELDSGLAVHLLLEVQVLIIVSRVEDELVVSDEMLAELRAFEVRVFDPVFVVQ